MPYGNSPVAIGGCSPRLLPIFGGSCINMHPHIKNSRSENKGTILNRLKISVLKKLLLQTLVEPENSTCAVRIKVRRLKIKSELTVTKKSLKGLPEGKKPLKYRHFLANIYLQSVINDFEYSSLVLKTHAFFF